MKTKKYFVFTIVSIILNIAVYSTEINNAMVTLRSGHHAEAIKILLPLANSGNDEAQRIIGEMCFNGQGMKRDPFASFKWNELASQNGNKIAQYNLGYLYENGEGIAASNSKALEWYSKAANQGHLPSQRKLGDLYVVTNIDMAIYWYDQARKNGDKEASILFSKLNTDKANARKAQEEANEKKQIEKERIAKEKGEEEYQQKRRERQIEESDQPDESIADYIQKVGQENSALLRKIDRQTLSAMNETKRKLAAQAEAREADRIRRLQREAEERKEKQQREEMRQARERQSQIDAREIENQHRIEAERKLAQQRQEQLRKDELLKQEREREKVKSDQLLKKQADELVAEKAQKEYFSKILNGIRLIATKCPDGEGHYYATGSKPKVKDEGCIDVSFEASCPDNRTISTGVAKNFIGMSGCFGDTYQIEPKPVCPIDQVKVKVTDVKAGCK